MSKLVICKPSKKPPAPPAPKPKTWLEQAIELVLVGLVLVGMVTVSAWIAGPPRPRVGWECWRVQKSTATKHEADSACYPARGWHLEAIPGVDGPVSIPDRARRWR